MESDPGLVGAEAPAIGTRGALRRIAQDLIDCSMWSVSGFLSLRQARLGKLNPISAMSCQLACSGVL